MKNFSKTSRIALTGSLLLALWVLSAPSASAQVKDVSTMLS